MGTGGGGSLGCFSLACRQDTPRTSRGGGQILSGMGSTASRCPSRQGFSGASALGTGHVPVTPNLRPGCSGVSLSSATGPKAGSGTISCVSGAAGALRLGREVLSCLSHQQGGLTTPAARAGLVPRQGDSPRGHPSHQQAPCYHRSNLM